MRYFIAVGAVILVALVAAFLAGLFDPSSHTDYALQKQLHAGSADQGIIWHPMPVDQAYETIPHQRTPYRPDLSHASRDEVDYLGALFALTDAALAERVSTQLKLQAGETAELGPSNYDAILSGILSLKTPAPLVPVEELIYQAISEQRRYLEAWRKAERGLYFNRSDPLVQSSHDKLTEAYGALKKLYAAEDPHNRQAMFDHLRALDFI